MIRRVGSKVFSKAGDSFRKIANSASETLKTRRFHGTSGNKGVETRIRKHPVNPKALDGFIRDYAMNDEVLGKGEFGEVRSAQKIETDQTYAVKILHKSKMTEEDIEDAHKEVYVMQSLSHPNIIKCIDHYEDDHVIYIVMELISGGELFHGLESIHHYTEANVIHIIRTLAKALKYCSGKGIIHRDIKAENILLREDDADSDIVLVDFGFAAHVKPGLHDMKQLETQCGTPAYAAPELYKGEKYSFKSDIWSLGVVACILLSGGLPIPADSHEELMNKMRTASSWSFEPPEHWRAVSDTAKDFLHHVLEFDSDKRFDYDEILRHKWLSGDDIYEKTLDRERLKKFNIKRKMARAAAVHRAAHIFGRFIGLED